MKVFKDFKENTNKTIIVVNENINSGMKLRNMFKTL